MQTRYLAAHVDVCLHEDVLRQGVVVSLSFGHGKCAGCRKGCSHSDAMLLAPAIAFLVTAMTRKRVAPTVDLMLLASAIVPKPLCTVKLGHGSYV